MKHATAIVMLVLCLGAEPTTKPTTQPATQPTTKPVQPLTRARDVIDLVPKEHRPRSLKEWTDNAITYMVAQMRKGVADRSLRADLLLDTYRDFRFTAEFYERPFTMAGARVVPKYFVTWEKSVAEDFFDIKANTRMTVSGQITKIEMHAAQSKEFLGGTGTPTVVIVFSVKPDEAMKISRR